MTDTSLGQLIDARFALRLKKTKLTKQLTTLDAEIEDLDLRLLAKMEVVGTDIGRTALATASIKDYNRINIEDYDQLIDWICEEPKERIYIFERRLGQSAVKELLEIGEEKIPGTVEFTKKVISLRKV